MFRKSLGIRHLVCGSCNGCEHEMNALTNAYYDITQEGWDIVASPRHADVVTVTGPMTEAMRTAAHETLEAVPAPRLIVAIGDCAVGEGPWSGAPFAGGGAVAELGATVAVRGCPPTPADIRAGLERAAVALDDLRADVRLARARRSAGIREGDVRHDVPGVANADENQQNDASGKGE